MFSHLASQWEKNTRAVLWISSDNIFELIFLSLIQPAYCSSRLFENMCACRSITGLNFFTLWSPRNVLCKIHCANQSIPRRYSGQIRISLDSFTSLTISHLPSRLAVRRSLHFPWSLAFLWPSRERAERRDAVLSPFRLVSNRGINQLSNVTFADTFLPFSHHFWEADAREATTLSVLRALSLSLTSESVCGMRRARR